MTKISNVRKTTKFKRSIKAISPVIATLLMIAIAVVASLVVYAWVTGYIGGTTSTAGKAIDIPSIASVGGHLYVYVQNVGQGQVALKQQESLYVNDNLVPITSPADPITINQGQTAELQTAFAFAPGDKVNIKVTTTDGTFMTSTGTGTSGGSPNPTNPPVQYAVNFVLGANGATITPTAGSHNVGGATPISATANTGYHFSSWTSTGSITFADASAASTTATVSGAGSITANFAQDTITYAVNFVLGANGATITPTAGSHNVGGATPISATANTGYHFSSWTSTGSITFADASAASTTATVSGAGSITANFAQDTITYAVNFVLGANGATITPTAGSHNVGGATPISATANTGYHFSSWTSTGSITFADASAASTTATVSGAGSITANFAANTPLTITLRPNAAGSTAQLSAQGTGTANWDRVDEVTADDATTYVRGSVSDTPQTDTYNIPDQALAGTITDVKIYIRVYDDTSRNDVLGWTALRIGTGSIQYGTQIQLPASWTNYNTDYPTKTGNLGSGAWTWADINSLQIGVQLQSHQSTQSGWHYASCTQVWVEITYTPA